MVLADLKKRRNEIISLAARHGACNIRVFGSVARGNSTPSSDIDLLVDFEPKRSLLDQADLIRDLETALLCHVDIVEPQGLHWFIKDQILSEATPL
jgi:uncharacterized protein